MVRRYARETAWMLGSALILVIALSDALASPRPFFKASDVPVARLHGRLRDQWLFLQTVRNVIPPGAAYTVHASNRDVEMSVFMISLAVLTRNEPRPRSYFRIETADGGRSAQYVVAFKDAAPHEPNVRVVASNRWGHVYERLR
ncbi:MAG: hypothetical protein ACYC7A_15890 [Thermoanaerobaculia bacterium]